MRLLPVVDLKGGLVVRGVAGRRAEYGPIVSQIAGSAKPADIGQGLVDRFGFTDFYVADLDAIQGAAPALGIYAQLASAKLTLWVDAGVSNLERARQLADCEHVGRVIVGLESVSGPGFVEEAWAHIGVARFVFSLDLKQGRPLTGSSAWGDDSAFVIAQRVVDLGVQHMIVLDLASVGTNEGISTLELCRALRDYAPRCEIISGGGVRNLDDLAALADCGCDRALVASAIHDGRLQADSLRERGWL